MDKTKRSAAMGLILCAAGCSHDEGNPAEIVKVAEKDGVRIYRFEDSGMHHWYALDGEGRGVPVSGR